MRLRVFCTDRVGLAHDVTQVFLERNISLTFFDMESSESLYLECEQLLTKGEKDELTKALCGIEGVSNVRETPSTPSKERAEQLEAVLTSVQEGILAVNSENFITQCNKAAAQILRLPAQQLPGYRLDDTLAKSLLVEETLRTGDSHINREVFVEAIDGYCVVSTVPLRTNDGEFVGVVAVVKEFRDVKALVQRMTASLPVTFNDITYVSSAMNYVIAQACKCAPGNSTILIRGETGTGKELFARALHYASGRSKNVFVPINCAAIPDTLLESELFGYEGGTFTGAAKGGKPGLFEMANGGTLFLDEVGELSMYLQAKLLRVLQERKVRRLGSAKELSVDVRIISATHCDLEDMVARRLFREDLYYRLNVIPLFLPSLRERTEDIPLLANQFLKRFADKLRTRVQCFSAEAMEKLLAYHWPGNVRELENVIERAVNLADGPEIQSEHIALGRIASGHKAAKVQFDTYQTLEERLNEVERDILQEALNRFHSSRRLGAVLGVSHTTVIKKLRKYKLWKD